MGGKTLIVSLIGSGFVENRLLSVPLLELRNRHAAIRAQAPTAAPLLPVKTGIVPACAFPGHSIGGFR